MILLVHVLFNVTFALAFFPGLNRDFILQRYRKPEWKPGTKEDEVTKKMHDFRIWSSWKSCSLRKEATLPTSFMCIQSVTMTSLY